MTAPFGSADRRTAAPRRPGPSALADEHAFLLHGVTSRAAAVTAVLDSGRWPHSELGALVSFLRSCVLRQASDEEVRLFPSDPYGAPFGELTAGHARLAAMTTQLERICADRCAAAQLRALVEDLRTALQRHLVDEEAVFAREPQLTTGGRPGVTADDGPAVIRLDTEHRSEAVQGCIERVLRLRHGQRAEIHASDDRRLEQVRRWIAEFDSAGFGATVTTTPNGRRVLQITRRGGD